MTRTAIVINIPCQGNGAKMSQKLLNALSKKTNVTLTENGAVTNKTTNSFVLDLFSQIGAYRTGAKAQNRIAELRKAYGENPLLTLKTVFYARDVRGGKGERETFRVFLKALVDIDPDSVAKNLALVPEYGRWDDLFVLKGTVLESNVVALIKDQLMKDIASNKPSLMAKWLPSINTSSAQTRALAKWLVGKLPVSPVVYRKTLSKLREKIRVLEALISRKKWDKVNYEQVPSNASLKYRKAFKRNDGERYKNYLASVEKGEKKINATTLFPYDLISKVLQKRGYGSIYMDATERKSLDLLWKNLPDFFKDKKEDSLVVVDVSGSMYSGGPPIPLHVSISLGIYVAERNKGVWQDRFMTFSNTPELVKLSGVDIVDKVNNVFHSSMGYNTDIEAVFNLILDTAIKSKLTQDDMVKRLYIVSDMEFDAAQASRGKAQKTLFRSIKDKFKAHGFEMPELIFWNVAARNVQFPMSLDDRGFLNVSGCSPEIFMSLLGKKHVSAYDLMLDRLNSPRYDAIVLA